MINMDLQLAIGTGVEIPDLFGNRAESNKNQIMSVLRQMKPKQSFVLPRLNLRNTASQAARELNLKITSRVMPDGQVRVWLMGDALTLVKKVKMRKTAPNPKVTTRMPVEIDEHALQLRTDSYLTSPEGETFTDVNHDTSKADQ